MTELDSITLTGLRVFAHHGVFDFERADGQEFVIDTTVWLVPRDTTDDDVASTVHYGDLANDLAAAASREPVDLIETLAERLAGVALRFAQVSRVRVTVHKPNAPIEQPFDDVAVTITRDAPERVVDPQPDAARAAVPARARVVVAFGGNLRFDGREPAEFIPEALRSLEGESVRVVSVSSLYRSVALTASGLDPEAPAYINGVALLETDLRPDQLLAQLQRVEADFGRERNERWGSRTLDLDIIDWNSEYVHTDALEVPHPRAVERGFVLVPWLEVDPNAALPGYGPIAQLPAAFDTAVQKVSSIEGSE